MLDINLLPWRKTAKQKRKKYEVFLLISSVILISLFIFLMRAFMNRAPQSSPVIHTVKQNQKPTLRLKWVGYLYEHGKFSGLIMLPDGRTIDVSEGATIGKNISVIHVDNRGMIIFANGKKERIFDAV